MANRVKNGSTTSGKSTAEAADVVRELLKAELEGEEQALVICDPHPRSLGWSVFRQVVALGMEDRVIFDRLSYLKRVPGYRFLTPSRATDELRRRMENDERTNAFANVMCRRRGVTGLEKNPETEEWTAAALDLYVNQEVVIPLPYARFAFYPQSQWFKKLLAQCRIQELTDKFAELRKGGLGKVASARRLMTSIFRSPAFEVRCGKTFKLEKFLHRGGILILEGGPGVSFDAMRTIMGAVILKVIDYVRNRSRPEPRVRLVIDEAANADLLGMFECRAMAETQKMGLDFSVLVQNLNFGSSAVTDGVLQNCLRHEWFYCANEAVARAGAADLGDSSYKDKLMILPRGVRIVKENRQVFQEYVKPLENLWHFPGLGEQKAKEELRRIRTRREYQDGKLSSSVSESDAVSTPAESKTSLTCSAADRLRTSASEGSGRKES